MKVQQKETVIVTMDIELSDPLQKKLIDSHKCLVLFRIQISIRQTMEKLVRKKGLPLVPRYVGMCRTDTSEIGAR